MRSIFVAGVLALLAGCVAAPPSSRVTATSEVTPEVTPETALTRLTIAADYGLGGVPFYEGGRWVANVRVEGCWARVKVGAKPAPQQQNPTQFEVLTVDGVPFANLSQENAEGLDADNLKDLVPAQLRC